MKMKFLLLITVLSLYLMGQIKMNSLFPDEKVLNGFDKLNLKTVVEEEQKLNSKDITPNYTIGIGTGIYPNKNKYSLSCKVFEKLDTPNFRIETNYFYDVFDSTVKVILYEWNYLPLMNGDWDEKSYYEQMFKVFKSKFEEIDLKLRASFAEPISKKLEKGKNKKKTYRDEMVYKRTDGLNAYLFMFRNSNYRQIRLAIYKD